MEVPIGTPIGTVLDICKIKHKPDTVVVGGTMNGVSVVNSELPVGPATRGIYALRTRLKTHFECMGCAKCIDACPSHLMPYYLYRLSKAGEYGSAGSIVSTAVSSAVRARMFALPELTLSPT